MKKQCAVWGYVSSLAVQNTFEDDFNSTQTSFVSEKSRISRPKSKAKAFSEYVPRPMQALICSWRFNHVL
jgi:hypothetical protein